VTPDRYVEFMPTLSEFPVTLSNKLLTLVVPLSSTRRAFCSYIKIFINPTHKITDWAMLLTSVIR